MVSRDQRLRKRADFDHVRSHGKRVSDRLFVLIVAPSEPDQTRWGLAVSRRVGNAVVRNRVKRKIRESIRDIRCINGQDVIVPARLPDTIEIVERDTHAEDSEIRAQNAPLERVDRAWKFSIGT